MLQFLLSLFSTSRSADPNPLTPEIIIIKQIPSIPISFNKESCRYAGIIQKNTFLAQQIMALPHPLGSKAL